MKRHKRQQDDSEINITPMLDVVFILLIFFIVTTSFVRESGIDVSRPTQDPDQQDQQEEQPILVRIDAASNVLIDKRQIDSFAIRVNLEREYARNPNASLIIAANEDARNDILVRVLDAANLVGIESVSLATER